MTPEERHLLIHRPFAIRYIGGAQWAGCIVGDSFPKGREGENLLHDAEVDSMPVVRDYVISDRDGERGYHLNAGKRYVLAGQVRWPTKAIHYHFE